MKILFPLASCINRYINQAKAWALILQSEPPDRILALPSTSISQAQQSALPSCASVLPNGAVEDRVSQMRTMPA